MPYVFLSFSSDNRATADQLKALMEQNGIQVWMSSYDIRPGEDFADAIPPAIEGCSCFVLLLTKEVLESEWVRKELDTVFGCRPKKVVIPVQLEQVQLDKGMNFLLKNCQILTLKKLESDDADVQRFIAMVKDAVEGRLKPRDLAPKQLPTKWLAIGGAAVALVLALVMVLPGLFGGSSTNEINQIPARYESDVQAVLDSTSSLDNISIKVGERYTPQKAKLGNVTIYSQDTRIAVGEGRQVVGVSAGTTYIVVVNENFPDMADAYRVTVEDESAPLVGVNQIPEHLNHLVEALKNGDKTGQILRLKVGDTKPLSKTFTDVTIYSGDTGIVVASGEGSQVKGVSAGTAYVLLVTSTGTPVAYFVEVSEA